MATSNETPNAQWATWALLKAWSELTDYGTLDAQRLAGFIVLRLRETLSEHDHGPRSYVVLTDDWRWGRGNTLAEACKASKAKRTARVNATLVLNDPQPSVNSAGSIESSSSSAQISLGWIGTIGSVLNAQPKP